MTSRPMRQTPPIPADADVTQASLPLTWPDEQPADAPRLPHLTLRDEMGWDLAVQGLSVRPHPLAFRRRELSAVGIVRIADLAGHPDREPVLVAGLVIAAQSPPTARGTAFLTLEDETGRVQAVVQPQLAESRLLAISGRIERSGSRITLLARAMKVVPAKIQPRPAAERCG